MSEIVQICKLLYVSPATTATCERLLSISCKENQEVSTSNGDSTTIRYSHVAIIDVYKIRTDALRVNVPNEFGGRNDNN